MKSEDTSGKSPDESKPHRAVVADLLVKVRDRYRSERLQNKKIWEEVLSEWELAFSDFDDNEVRSAWKIFLQRHQVGFAPEPAVAIEVLKKERQNWAGREYGRGPTLARWKIHSRWINHGTEEKPRWVKYEYATDGKRAFAEDLPGVAYEPETKP